MVGVAAFQHEGSSSVVLIVILFVVEVFFGRALVGGSNSKSKEGVLEYTVTRAAMMSYANLTDITNLA